MSYIKTFGITFILCYFHNRVLARLETLNWWIEQSAKPKEQLIRLSNVLFSSLDDMTENYHKSNWSKARVNWGPPMLQRNLVKTQKAQIDIPSSLRNSAIREVFFQISLYPTPFYPNRNNKRAQWKNKHENSHIPLSKQVIIISNSLDPRERYLPILPSSDERAIQMKHSIIHNNLDVVNYIGRN